LEAWISFFMRGVKETAEGAVATAQRLAQIFREDRERIQKLGRISGSACAGQNRRDVVNERVTQ
jgi:hypothetical protein